MTRVARRAALISVTGALIAGMAAFGTMQASAQSGGGASPAPVSGHPAAVTTQQQASVNRYWTPARMRHAEPLSPRSVHGGAAAPRRSFQSAPLVVAPDAPRAGGPGAPPLPRASDLRAGGSAAQQAPRASDPRARGSLAPRADRTGRTGRAGRAGSRPHTLWAGLAGLAGHRARAPRRVEMAAGAGGALWRGGGAVTHTTGKVFLTIAHQDYVCSASTVAGPNPGVVLTAAHCVQNPGGAWATNWTFVPGYANGNEPFGSYTARRFYVARQWSTQGDNNYDLAFVTVNPATIGGTTIPVEREVGGQGIEFGTQPVHEIAFGYPAEPPYNGERLSYCAGRVSRDPYGETNDTGLRCAMTAGSSGGPWLSAFDRATGMGTITSVSSFKYDTNEQILYGPELGPAARSLYQSAQRG